MLSPTATATSTSGLGSLGGAEASMSKRSYECSFAGRGRSASFLPVCPSFCFLNRGQFPAVHSPNASTLYSSFTPPADTPDNMLLYDHLPTPQLYTFPNNTGRLWLLHLFPVSFGKLIIDGQFENRLESPQGCWPGKIEKEKGRAMRLPPCPPSCFSRGRGGGGKKPPPPPPCDGRGNGEGKAGRWRRCSVRILNIWPSAFISQVSTKSPWITPAGRRRQYREKP